MGVYCVSWLVIRLFHLTSFVWMFLEGRSQIEKVSRKFLWTKINHPCVLFLFLRILSLPSSPVSVITDIRQIQTLHHHWMGWVNVFYQFWQCIVQRDKERISRDASAVEVYKLGLPFSIKWYWKTLDKAHLFQWSAICYLRICSCLNKETFRNFRFLI